MIDLDPFSEIYIYNNQSHVDSTEGVCVMYIVLIQYSVGIKYSHMKWSRWLQRFQTHYCLANPGDFCMSNKCNLFISIFLSRCLTRFTWLAFFWATTAWMLKEYCEVTVEREHNRGLDGYEVEDIGTHRIRKVSPPMLKVALLQPCQVLK